MCNRALKSIFAAGAAAALSLIALGTEASAETEVVRTFKVNSWSARAVVDKSTRQFSHCSALAPYAQGASLFFSVGRNYSWTVAFSFPEISLKPNQTVKIALSIDDAPPSTVTGVAVTSQALAVDLLATTELFDRFRRGATLKVTARDIERSFILTDTSRVLPALVECVNTALNPIPMQAPAQTQTAAKPPVREDHRAEATTFLANLLSQAGMPNFKIELTPLDLVSEHADAYWTAGVLSGSVMLIPDRGIRKPADVAPIVIGAAASACKGSFLSGALPEEAGGTLARAFTHCETNKGGRTAFYFTVARPGGGHFVFATWADDSAREQVEEADVDIRKVVLKTGKAR
jgi:hypothetical protein